MITPKWFRDRADSSTDRDLWWVRLMLNVGRPAVAVLVLAMCAPGEHYLALQAGWNETLAWGMPGTLTAYAGIAAVVATKRAPGSPGKGTAVWGAVLSIVTAMAAQPIAHLYGRPGLGPQQVTLIVIVSCIPALVFGHLLHMAAVRTPDKKPASGGHVATYRPAADSIPADLSAADIIETGHVRADISVADIIETGHVRPDSLPDSVSAGQLTADMDTGVRPDWLYDGHAVRDEAATVVSGPDTDTDSRMSVDAMSWNPEDEADMERWAINPATPLPALPVRPVRTTAPAQRVGRTADGSVGSFAKDLIELNPDMTDDLVRRDILDRFGPDTKSDTIRKAIKRAREARSDKEN
jgi:hypothetical protein